ncbi:MAG: hypothetical protein IT289_07670 [Oligoflexia bacterium]|nr:hypothetical protein [Oligoflexia bacterium]
MLNKFVCIAISISMAVPSVGFSNIEKQTDPKILQLATQLVENTYHIQVIKGELVEQEAALNSVGQTTSFDWNNRLELGSSIALAILSVYLIKQSKKYHDVRALFALLFGGASGLASLGMGATFAVDAGIARWMKNSDKKKIQEQINQAKLELAKLESESKARLEALRTFDPEIDSKVSLVIQSHDYQVPRFIKLRKELGELKGALERENTELMFSGITTVGSIYQLAKSVARVGTPLPQGHLSHRTQIGLAAVGALLVNLWTLKNVNDKQEVLEDIAEVERHLSEIEGAYKYDLLAAIQSGAI